MRGESASLPPMSRARERAGRSMETLVRPVVPSGKAKVRSLTRIVGGGIVLGGDLDLGASLG